jgi:putrescine---pyruvate transaminase
MKTFEQFNQLDSAHVIHPHHALGDACSIVVDSGQGIYLKDIAGKEYIDGRSQLTCVNLGYGRGEIIDAIKKQADKLQYLSLFYGATHEPIVECAARLAAVTPDTINHFLFTSGGSEATESAFMIARLYWTMQEKNKNKIISLYRSYHGNTAGAIGATGMEMGGQKSMESLPGYIHIPPYYCFRCSFGHTYPSCNIRCARYLGEVIEREGPDSIGVFIAEPILGVGGIISPPPEYFRIIREICTRYNVLFIADEIQTGFCRTGKFFAVQHWSVEPDMLLMGKGITGCYIPFGAVGVSDRIYEGIKGGHLTGFTHGGHPIAAAAACAAIDIYVQEKIAEHVAEVGEYVLRRLATEFTALPSVADATGLGLMIGLEIVKDKETKAAHDSKAMATILPKALAKGLMVRARDTRMGFTPPLIITKEESDKALDILMPILAHLAD